MKKLLPFAASIALFILPPTAFASKFAFNSPVAAHSSDSLTASHEIVSASICSLNIANRGGTDELLTNLLNNSTPRDWDAGNNSNANEARGGLDNIKLFETSLNTVSNGGSPASTFGFKSKSIYLDDETHLAFVAAPSVPEPMSMLLLGSGLAGLYVRRRRQKNSA